MSLIKHNKSIVLESDIIILCVKPMQVKEVCEEICARYSSHMYSCCNSLRYFTPMVTFNQSYNSMYAKYRMWDWPWGCHIIFEESNCK